MFNVSSGALIESFTSPKLQSNGEFGYSTSLAGDKLLVGAASENSGGKTIAGNAYVFAIV